MEHEQFNVMLRTSQGQLIDIDIVNKQRLLRNVIEFSPWWGLFPRGFQGDL